MDAQEYTSLLENLERELTAWASADCTHLLGILERVRVLAWAKVLGSSRDSTQAPLLQDGGRLLTLPQVAERLTIPEGYAYELARRGMLPVVRLGKYVRVPLAELETWVGQQTTPQRRIDNGQFGFHSGTLTPRRQTPMPAKARPEPGKPQRERKRPVRSQPKPDADQPPGVRPAAGVVAVNDPIPECPE